jgi:glutathione S-transferase
MPKITVHHLENSRSQRILWLLEELGLDYEIRKYQRDPLTSLGPAELQALHPLGKAPLVTDGELTLAESGAIIEYLVATYGKGRLRPAEGTSAALAYTYWLHYAEGSFMPLMLLSLIISRIESAPMPFFARPIAKGIAAKVRGGYLDANVKRNIDFLESSLNQSIWFCGDQLTAADIQMSFAVEAASVRALAGGDYPNLAAFLKRMKARPAYRRALEKGGPYELLGGSTKK